MVGAHTMDDTIGLRHAETERRLAWQSATTNVVTLLLSGEDLRAVRTLIVGHARRLANAAGAALTVGTEDPALLRLTVGTGVLAPQRAGECVCADPAGISASAAGIGPVVAAPVNPGTTDLLLVARGERADPLSPAEVEMLTSFAEHVGLALALAHARRRHELERLVEDRERIAAHLSEQTMQGLLAISTAVHGLTARMQTPEDAYRLTEQVDRLDAVLRDMQRAIFGLRLKKDRDISLC